MGVVYRARSPEGGAVAIKLLARVDEATRARFERERRLLASFSEADGFVPLRDAGAHEGGPYLVMPLVEGGTLRDKLASGRLGAARTLALGRQLAGAIGKAHERGVIHRDLKPENVLFAADGRPLIADLGLAKHFDRGASGASQSVSLSGEGGIRGTAGYMAPEQMADPKGVGPPADVFALGAILYECLSGRPAFTGETLLDVIARASEARFERLGGVAPGTPPWLAALVERALARDPARRFRDGLELRRALERGPVRRRGPLVAGLGAAALVALAVFAGTRSARAPAPRPAPPPPAPALLPPAPAARPPAQAPPLPARAGSPAPTASADELAPGAERKLEANDVEGALADAKYAVEVDPGSAKALGVLGLVLTRKGDLEGALAAYTRATELDPKLTGAWADRAVVRNSLGDYKGAIEDESRAIELDPGLAEAWGGRGAMRNTLHDYGNALADLNRAVELQPRDADVWRDRGVAREGLGDHAGALEDTTRAIELDPGNARAWVERGRAKEGKGDLDGAIADAAQAIKLAPGLAGAWANRGAARENKGDHAEAVADLTRALELDPKAVLAWKSRAMARSKLGDTAGAASDVRHFLELAPDDPEAGKARQWLDQNAR